MPRIHDWTPTLKTLFQIRTWKPGSQQWNKQHSLQLSEENTLSVVLHSTLMAQHLLDDAEWPPYVLQAHYNDDIGFVTLKDESGVPINRADILLNPYFDGVRITLELDSRSPRAHMLRDLYARLKEIADAYAEEQPVEVDFAESFCWLGGHISGLAPAVKGK